MKRDAGWSATSITRSRRSRRRSASPDPGSDFDVDQAENVIVVNDRSQGLVSRPRRPLAVGRQHGGDRRRHRRVGHRRRGDRPSQDARWLVWKLDRTRLSALTTLDDEDPMLTGSGTATGVVRTDGSAAIVDRGADKVIFLSPDGRTSTSPKLGLTDDLTGVTLVGDTAVLVDADGDVFAVSRSKVSPLDSQSGAAGLRSTATALTLQQPGPAARQVVATTAAGEVLAIDLASGERTDVATLQGTAPVAPIVYGGCLFEVVTQPPQFTQLCGDKVVQTTPLEGSGSELRPAIGQRLDLGQRSRHRRGVGDQPAAAASTASTTGATILSADSTTATRTPPRPTGGRRQTRGQPQRRRRGARATPTRSTRTAATIHPFARDDEPRPATTGRSTCDVLTNDDRPRRRRHLGHPRCSRPAATRGLGDALDRAAMQVSPAAGFIGDGHLPLHDHRRPRRDRTRPP